MKASRAAPTALAATAVLLFASFAATAGRVPIPWPDAQLYASIARSLQLHGTGVPSTIWFSPTAVDHIPFYGPVYFALTSLAFTLFGFSIESSRIPGLLGVVLLATAAAMLAGTLSGERTRWLWAMVLVLLTPEIGVAATNGDQETLAVGLQLMGLAVYVRGMRGDAPRWMYGVPAGVCALLAALTTPRTYPFVAAFLLFAGAAAMMSRRRASALAQWCAAAGICVAGFGAWTVYAFGGPLQWIRDMTFILSREDRIIMVLPTGSRELVFNWSSALTPVAAAFGAVLAGWSFVRHVRRDDNHLAWGVAFATTIAAGLVAVVGLNLTFSLGVYFAIPILCVVIASPRHMFAVSPAALNVLLAVVLALDAGIAAVRYARAAATWEARNSAPLTAFLQRHVGAGSSVVGPNAIYFFAVESVGAHYRSFLPESHSDWARWAVELEAFRPPADRRAIGSGRNDRFLIWQASDAVPLEYACALPMAINAAPPNHLHRIGVLGGSWDTGYPDTALYRLPPDCPPGYDPTGFRTE